MDKASKIVQLILIGVLWILLMAVIWLPFGRDALQMRAVEALDRGEEPQAAEAPLEPAPQGPPMGVDRFVDNEARAVCWRWSTGISCLPCATLSAGVCGGR